MTETPPPGKTWVTIEIESETDGLLSNGIPTKLLGRDVVQFREGPDREDPSDKCNRLLGEAEFKFRDACYSYPTGGPANTGKLLSEGAELLAQALKVFREEL